MVLGGVIYLHDISQDRFSGTARRNLEMFNRLCGDAALDKVVLGTTKWSRLSPNDGSRREAELKNVHWKEMVTKGSEVRRFEGNQESAWRIVSVFLQRASQRRKNLGEMISLQIQTEIAVKRRIIPETKAGKELRFTLQEFLEMQKMAVALEEEMAREGGSGVDAKLEETRQNLDKRTTQIQDLKVPLSRRIKRFIGLVVSRLMIVAWRSYSYLRVVNCSERSNQRLALGSGSVFPVLFVPSHKHIPFYDANCP